MAIWRLEDMSNVTRPERISLRWRIRSIERSRIETFAPSSHDMASQDRLAPLTGFRCTVQGRSIVVLEGVG